MKTLNSESWSKLARALKEKNYTQISQYAQEQALGIILDFIKKKTETKTKLDSIERLLNYYKISIDSKRDISLYELGKLEGYVKCIKTIEFENFLNEESLKVFKEAKEHLPKELESYARKVILELYKSGCYLPELRSKIKIPNQKLDNIVSVLRIYGIIGIGPVGQVVFIF